MEYAFLILTIAAIIAVIHNFFKPKKKKEEFLSKCRFYLQSIHPNYQESIKFRLVKKFAKNRYKIKYELNDLDREVLVQYKNGEFEEIAKIKELEDDIALQAVKYSHRKIRKNKPIKRLFRVMPPGSPSYYCVETKKGRRFYYSKLGQDIIPNF